MPSLNIVHTARALLDELRPPKSGKISQEHGSFVADRPSHDRGHAIDARKIEQEVGWKPTEMIQAGIAKWCSGMSTTTMG